MATPNAWEMLSADSPVCPSCGHHESDAHELFESQSAEMAEVHCEHCDHKYRVIRDISVKYTSEELQTKTGGG